MTCQRARKLHIYAERLAFNGIEPLAVKNVMENGIEFSFNTSGSGLCKRVTPEGRYSEYHSSDNKYSMGLEVGVCLTL